MNFNDGEEIMKIKELKESNFQKFKIKNRDKIIKDFKLPELKGRKVFDKEEIQKLEQAVYGISHLWLFVTCCHKPKDPNLLLPDWAIEQNKKLFREFGKKKKRSFEEINEFERKLIQPHFRCIQIPLMR
jgi:hypothetical protein